MLQATAPPVEQRDVACPLSPAWSYLLLAALAACAAGPGPGPAGVVRTLPLDAEVAAALAAAAMRAELPFADPLPYAAGAPLTRLGAHEFVIRYERRRDGAWLPVATHRARLPMPTRLAADSGPVLLEPAEGMVGAGPGLADDAFEIRVQANPRGCELTFAPPVDRRHDFVGRLDRTWDLAATAATGVPGLSEPNLVAFVCRRLVAEAAALRAADRQAEAEARLATAMQLGLDAPALAVAWGRPALLRGDPLAAPAQLRHAALASGDPAGRRAIAGLAAATRRETGAAESMRRVAAACLAAGDLEGAADLLHSARRASPHPEHDYLLLGRVHRRDGDQLAARADELLAREHAADTAVAATPVR